jgi:hypothetical protein
LKILFYFIFLIFKVLDMVLEVTNHTLIVKGNYPEILVWYIYFYFLFHFFLGGNGHGVSYDTVVTGILDMCVGKHDLHFLVGAKLLPHAFVNIPDEKMHIGVILHLLLLSILFLFCIFWIYLFVVFYLVWYDCNTY